MHKTRVVLAVLLVGIGLAVGIWSVSFFIELPHQFRADNQAASVGVPERDAPRMLAFAIFLLVVAICSTVAGRMVAPARRLKAAVQD